MDTFALNEDAQNMPVYTSFAMGLLEDLATHLTGLKQKAVLRAHQTLKRAHQYWDRNQI